MRPRASCAAFSIERLRAATADALLHGKPLMGKRLLSRPSATLYALSAARTLSGVNGTERSRTPTAS